jgi:hypothetical protein
MKKNNYLLNNVYITLIILNGVITAFIKFFEINFLTHPINIITIFYLPIFIYAILKSKGKSVRIVITIYIFFLVVKYFLLFGFNLLDLFRLILDILSLISFFYFYELNQENKIKSLRVFQRFVFFFTIIFFVQWFYYDILPDALIKLPNLLHDVEVDRYERDYSGTTIFRPNGLVGNPITFGFFLNLLLVIEVFFYRLYGKKQDLIKITLILTMIFLLFSRANVFLAILIIFLNFLRKKNFFKILLGMIISLLVAIPLNNFLYSSFTYYQFMIDRFTSEDKYSAASNLEHLKDYSNVYQAFLQNPIIGMNVSEIINQEIITDGALLFLLLKLGGICFIFLIVLYVFLIKKYQQQWANYKITSSFYFFIILLIPYSILNSAILDRGIYLLVFLFLGITSNLYSKNITK